MNNIRITYQDTTPTTQFGDPRIILGTTDGGEPFGVYLNQLVAGRLFIQGTSGAGKSWLMRKLIEESRTLMQQVIIDPEGELSELASRLETPVVIGSNIKQADLGTLGERARQQRQSLSLDLSQVDRKTQLQLVTALLRSIVGADRQFWWSALVALDEVQLFSPQEGGGGDREFSRAQQACSAAVIDLLSRGRKRGLAAVVSTLRIARVSKSVVAEAQNFMIGLTTMDIDIKRAAAVLGWEPPLAHEILPNLKPGQFVTMGQAFFPRSNMIVEVGGLHHPNIGGTPTVTHAPEWRSARAGRRVLGLP
jgi:hypothetical protein